MRFSVAKMFSLNNYSTRKLTVSMWAVRC